MDGRPVTAGPGWYDDPYRTGWVRWFDGTEWTTHAVAADGPRPDRIVEERWDGRTGDGRRADTRESSRPVWDVAVPRAGEPAYDGGGGVGGLRANRAARLGTRIGPKGVVHLTRYVAAATVVLVVLAWGDAHHRVVFGALAGGFLVVTVVVGIRTARERARWRRLSDEA